jgi:hypothetical protein
VRQAPPWIISVRPTVARNSSRPRPGNPLGKVENSLCSSPLLGAVESRRRQATGGPLAANPPIVVFPQPRIGTEAFKVETCRGARRWRPPPCGPSRRASP